MKKNEEQTTVQLSLLERCEDCQTPYGGAHARRCRWNRHNIRPIEQTADEKISQ